MRINYQIHKHHFNFCAINLNFKKNDPELYPGSNLMKAIEIL